MTTLFSFSTYTLSSLNNIKLFFFFFWLLSGNNSIAFFLYLSSTAFRNKFSAILR